MVARGLEEVEWGKTINEYGVSIWSDENLHRLDHCDVCKIL